MAEGFAAPSARSIDVTCLPEAVVELINALGPGENLVLTRGGAPVALTRGALEGVIVAPGAQDEPAPQPPATNDNATVVASALKLSTYVRGLLSDELGEDYVVLDIYSAPPTADVLLVGPVSLQLIGNLRSMFPRARVMVVEVEDDDLGIRSQGPVHRLIDAGAETYLVSSTISGLAMQLDQAVTQRPQLTGGAPARLGIEAAPTTPAT